MADLGTILFGNFSTLYSTVTGTVGTQPVLDNITTPVDSSYVHDDSNLGGSNTMYAWFPMGDTPSDFLVMSTLSINVRYRRDANSANKPWDSLAATLFTANGGSTVLVDTRTIATNITTTTATNSGALAFTGVDAIANKTTWDGAWLRLEFTYTKSMAGNTDSFQVTAAEITGTYVQTSSDVTATGAPTLAAVTSVGVGDYTPPPVTATGTSTLSNVTSVGVGSYTPPPVTATGTSTLSNVTSVGAGTATVPQFNATGAPTLAPVTSTGVGDYTPAPVTATGTSTLSPVTSVGVGTYTSNDVTGSGSPTLSNVTSVGTGTYVVPISLSETSNVPAGGEATTALLDPPAGKTTGNFSTGRRWDDENGTDTLDHAANTYTEYEWWLVAGAVAAQYEFRVVIDGSPADTYTVTPKWTITLSNDVTGSGAPTLAAVTSVGVGDYTPPPISATGAPNLSNVTSVGVATNTPPQFTATGAPTLSNVTSVGVATNTPPQFSATGAPTLAAVTSVGVGDYTPPPITATGASTLSPVTSVGAGTVTAPQFAATGAPTLSSVTSVGAGTATVPQFTATGAPTLSSVTSVGAGTATVPQFTATGASTLSSVTAVGVGAYTPPPVSATGSPTLSAVTSVGTGAYVPSGDLALLNTFDSPPTGDGDVLSPANSGGGNGTPIDFIVTNGGNAVYDSDIRLHGPYSALLPGASAATYLEWDSTRTGLPVSTNAVWMRVYFRVGAIPTANMVIGQFEGSSGTPILTDLRLVGTGTPGALQIRIPQTARFTSTQTLSTDTWYRLEWQVRSTSTQISGLVRVFFGDNIEGTTPDWTLGNESTYYTVTGFTNGLIGGHDFGVMTNGGTTINMSVEDWAMSDATWLGPSGFLGIGSSTLAATTSVGVGANTPPQFTATGAPTLSNVTSVGAGTVTVPQFSATGAPTLSNVTSVGAGTNTPPAVTGSGAPILDPATSVGTGTASVNNDRAATGAPTLDPVTAVGVGDYTPPPVTATGASTLAPVTSVGVGTAITSDDRAGVGAPVLAAVTSVGVGDYTPGGLIGTGVAVLDPVYTDATYGMAPQQKANFGSGYVPPNDPAERRAFFDLIRRITNLEP